VHFYMPRMDTSVPQVSGCLQDKIFVGRQSPSSNSTMKDDNPFEISPLYGV